MRNPALLVSACLVVVASGCGPDVVLLSEDGGVRLEYECRDWERQVWASYEEAVIQDYGRRILQEADRRGDAETVTEIFMALEHSTVGLLEDRVVRYVCDFGLPAGGTSPDPVFPQVGSTARDFTLPLLTAAPPFLGDSVTLSSHRGQVVLFETWGTWCWPCVSGYPRLSDFAREYGERGVAVYGILLNDSPARAAEWFAENGGMAFPFLVGSEEMTSAWAMIGAPSAAIVDAEGRVAHRCFGCMPERLRAPLDSILSKAGGR